MVKALINAVRFFWRASAGYRLQPWKSPYLRWRVETYTGKPAGSLRLADFLKLAFDERHQIGNFFRWVGELRELTHGKTA